MIMLMTKTLSKSMLLLFLAGFHEQVNILLKKQRLIKM